MSNHPVPFLSEFLRSSPPDRILFTWHQDNQHFLPLVNMDFPNETCRMFLYHFSKNLYHQGFSWNNYLGSGCDDVLIRRINIDFFNALKRLIVSGRPLYHTLEQLYLTYFEEPLANAFWNERFR